MTEQIGNSKIGDVSIAIEGNVGWVEIHRPPHNHFDQTLIHDLAQAVESLDTDASCRALVLASEGKSFCAGADFARPGAIDSDEFSVSVGRLYTEALRLFNSKKPIVAAIQGAAVGGGLGLALVADFRVVSPEARFAANFVKLGIYPGFGLSYTLPRLVGLQRASLMLYTGCRISGEEAVAWGLADILAAPDSLREQARKLAAELAEGAPLALQSIRGAMREGTVAAVREHTRRELAEQSRLIQTEDHREGVAAVKERRPGRFHGR